MSRLPITVHYKEYRKFENLSRIDDWKEAHRHY